MGVSDAVPIPSPVLKLNQDEEQLVKDYRLLNDEGRSAASSYIKYLQTEEKYKKVPAAPVQSGMGA